MYRPSTAFSTKPRESVFFSGALRQEDDSLSLPFLEACVSAAHESSSRLYDAQCSLRRGVSDLPRLTKILRNEQLFVLINESHTEMCRAQLGEEVGPQILELIERGEKGIKHLEKKAVLLKSKLQAAQLNSAALPPARKLDALIKERKALEREVQKLNAEIRVMEEKLEQ